MKPWEKYASAEGPWNKYANPMQEQVVAKKSTPGNPGMVNEEASKAFVESIGQGAAFGYLPQLQAKAEPITDRLFGLIGSKDVEPAPWSQLTSNSPEYVASRDRNIERLKEQQEKFPVTTTAGNVGGGLLATAAAPALAAESAIGRVALGAATGAGYGLLQNPGDKKGEVDVVQPEERIKNAQTGAIVGGAASGAIEGAKAATNAGKWLMSKAEEKAFKSSGAMLKDYRKALKRGGENRVKDIGKTMIDYDLVRPGESFKEVAERSDELLKKTGQDIGSIYTGVLDNMTDPKVLSKLNASQIKELNMNRLNGSQIASEMTSDLKSALKGQHGGNRAIKQIESELEEIASLGEVSVAELNAYKSSLGKTIDWGKANNELPAIQQARQKVYDILNDRIEKHVDVVDKILKTSETKALKKANKLYSNISEINRISSDRNAREGAKNFFGLTDTIIGGAVAGPQVLEDVKRGDIGGAVKDIAVGFGAAAASKYSKLYGNPILTKSLNALGKNIDKIPKEQFVKLLDVAQKNPAQFQKAVDSLINKPKGFLNE